MAKKLVTANSQLSNFKFKDRWLWSSRRQAHSRISSQAQSSFSSQAQSRLSSQAQCARSIWHSNDNVAVRGALNNSIRFLFFLKPSPRNLHKLYSILSSAIVPNNMTILNWSKGASGQNAGMQITLTLTIIFDPSKIIFVFNILNLNINFNFQFQFSSSLSRVNKWSTVPPTTQQIPELLQINFYQILAMRVTISRS